MCVFAHVCYSSNICVFKHAVPSVFVFSPNVCVHTCICAYTFVCVRYQALAAALSAVCSSLTAHPLSPASPTPAKPQCDCVFLQINTGFGAPAIHQRTKRQQILFIRHTDKCLNTSLKKCSPKYLQQLP